MAKLSPLVVIVGETASGKSSLAMQIAKQFNGEIICADSRTIYKAMDIGTAKPSKKDREEIKHYLLDIIEPNQRYSASLFKKDALEAISNIANRGKLPIMVGGTGLYVDAVLFDYSFSSGEQQKDSNNPRHLSKSTQKNRGELRPNTLVIGLNRSRDELNIRIEERAKQMLEAGFINEVNTLVDKYGTDNEALSGIGYRTFAKYLRGDITLELAKAEFVKGDKSLAKRQRTWFKRNKSIHWINPSQANKIVHDFVTKNRGG